MNAIVQTLNTAGRAFVGAAVPMLIQSSLLILILLAVDTVLRKRMRAVFRYWIWMLVLVKLVLPPSLWSPVSVGTWVGDTLEVPAAALLERGGYVSRASSPRFEGGTPSTQQGPGSPNAISSRLGTHDALATRLSPAVADFLSQPQPMTVVPSPAEPCGPAALGWGSITPEGGGATRSVAHPPALLVNTKGQGHVIIENLTIRWQLAGNEKAELSAALLVKGTNVVIRNCRFAPLGDFRRSPMAVYIDRPSKSTVDNCRFSGFDYVVCYGQGTEGVVQDCLITDCGHQGVIGYDGSTLTVQRNIITGSKFHAVRCTGGTLTVKDNLLVKNANRGIYLGNKTGQGTIANNLIVGNGSGISGFGRANYVIANNVVADNSFSGIDMRDSCRFSIRNNVLVKNQRGLALFKEGTENFNVIGKNAFWANATDVESLERPAGSLTADPQFADPNHGDFAAQGAVREQEHGLANPQILKDLWQRYEQLRTPSAGAGQPQAPARKATPSAPQELSGRVVDTGLAWQRTDRYVPPDPNGFFPDDPEGGKKLDALFQAVDKDQRSDEEILSTVRQGLRRVTRYRAEILGWIGNRYIWNKDPQNPQAVEILYQAVPLEQPSAVYYGLSVLRHKPANVLRTMAEICMHNRSDEVGRITWGLGPQREALLPYLTPYLQDPNAARRELAGVLVKNFKGELDFDQWRREKLQEQLKARFAGRLPQFNQTLLTGDSNARYQALMELRRAGGLMVLDDSALPALQAAGTDPDRRVRNEVAQLVGNRWVWAAQKQDPNAIALMVRLGADSDREVRYNAVYYGLSVVREKGEPVVRRLVELALTDHGNSLYGRIVWGLRGFSKDTSETVAKVLTEHLGRAKTDAHHAASIYLLYRDVLEKEPPEEWGLAQVRQQYPEDLFVLPFSAREPFQPADTDALWSEFNRALPEGIAAQRLPTWDTNKKDICYARIRGKEQAEAIRKIVGNYPRLRVGEVRPLPLATQLYMEEKYGVGAVMPQKNQPQ